MSALRPLPPRPSLEFERKEAKALLRQLRAGDADALTRARARHPDLTSPTDIRLTDAQLIIAREYGFTSWPRLVRYFGDVERLRHSLRAPRAEPQAFFDSSVRGLLAEHRDRRVWTARVLASYVPRFYGMPVDDVFASDVTEDDARLGIARTYGSPSWKVLLEEAATEAGRRPGEWEQSAQFYAARAIEAADLDALKRVVDVHPELLRPSEIDRFVGRSLIRTALRYEQRIGAAALRPIMQWLEANGFDLQWELNRLLCGGHHMPVEKVRWLLDRGADPNWVAPNGIPVLEHALIRYGNGKAVDLLAARTAPRKALWISAALGDVDGVRRSLDANGRPLPNACRLRPDFDAVGHHGMLPHPDPGDEDLLLEAFAVAMLNGRTAVLEYMVSRGFPLNSLAWGMPLVCMAVGNGMVAVAECLVRCGADLDLRGWRPNQTAREMARELFTYAQEDPIRRGMVELCGMDPDTIIAELDSRPASPPRLDPKLTEVLELAGDDAFRLGRSTIGPENLLFGLLRARGLALDFFTKYSRMDLDRFRADVWLRVHRAVGAVDRESLALDEDANAVIQLAIAAAAKRRRESVNDLFLLVALLEPDDGIAADILRRYGADPTTVRENLLRAI